MGYAINFSARVRAGDFTQPWMSDRVRELNLRSALHRKVWELAVIAQIYHERIGAGGRVLGFGVGKEPLPAWFASRGANVLATDKPIELSASGWAETDQHASSVNDLPYEDICDEETFHELVSFAPVDMNQVHALTAEYDLTWSCGSFEHIGGIQRSLEFFCNQMSCLKPGGVAVHTTEFNFLSNGDTIDNPQLCLLRRRDLDRLRSMLESQDDELLDFDLEPGDAPADMYIDPPPYTGEMHLNLQIGAHASTSIVLVAVKGAR
jgi:hypothetical protein